jgi:hypothetical protein
MWGAARFVLPGRHVECRTKVPHAATVSQFSLQLLVTRHAQLTRDLVLLLLGALECCNAVRPGAF